MTLTENKEQHDDDVEMYKVFIVLYFAKCE